MDGVKIWITKIHITNLKFISALSQHVMRLLHYFQHTSAAAVTAVFIAKYTPAVCVCFCDS